MNRRKQGEDWIYSREEGKEKEGKKVQWLRMRVREGERGE